MFEWKAPDPRLVAFVRRLEATARRRFGAKQEGPATIDAMTNEEGPAHGEERRISSADGDERRISSADGELEIVDVPERRRYEVRIGSRVVGHVRYARSGEAITLVHTEVDPDQEGKGIGSRLAVAVLTDVTSRDLSVVVRCPFIAAYIRRHPADYPTVEVRD